MAGGDTVLQFDLKDGEYADAILASESLIAWVNTIQAAAKAIDPFDLVRVEIIASERGSLRHLLRIVETTASDIAAGANEYPTLKKLAIGLALGTAPVLIDHALQPSVQMVALSETDRILLRDWQKCIRDDSAVEIAAKRFYRVAERDHAITAVRIGQDHVSAAEIVIPRDQFPDKSGLWDLQEEEPPEEVRRAIWHVVLLKAAFTHEPRAWTFSRDGLPFSARMEDKAFLAAIAAKTVPISLQEGVMMQIEVEYRERLEGQVWQYVDRSRKVVRVVTPKPLPPVTPPDAPKEKQ